MPSCASARARTQPQGPPPSVLQMLFQSEHFPWVHPLEVVTSKTAVEEGPVPLVAGHLSGVKMWHTPGPLLGTKYDPVCTSRQILGIRSHPVSVVNLKVANLSFPGSLVEEGLRLVA